MELKYQKIYQKIKENVLKGVYFPSGQLPDEKTIALSFSVSRMTVKKALDLLVQEGYIYRKRGHGTFVLSQLESQRRIIIPERDIKGLTKIASDAHVPIESKVLNFSLEFASKKVSSNLQIKLNDPVYNILRLRLISQKPYVLEQTYMPTALIPGLSEKILDSSVYQYIENELNLRIASANKMLRASISSEQEQLLLNLKPTEPVFEVEQIAYLDDGKPFEYSISRHRYDLFEFSSFALKS